MKKKISKNNRTKKNARLFAKKQRRSANSRAQNIRRHTSENTQKNKSVSPAKAPIEPQLGMTFDGILYKMRAGRGGARYYVVPSSRRISFDIAVQSPLNAKEGELVEVKLIKLPHRDNAALCKITKVFGAADSKEANYEAILSANGIETEFPYQVTKEAQAVSEQPLSPEGREDLRTSLIFTIDGADAKDLDDAVSLTVKDDGWELGVHIADVSHYVREDSETDREAMRRGTSVYFTDKVVPMLPKSLSNGACSLNAGEDKYAMSAHITLDSNAKLVGVKIKKSIINSAVRGVYSEVNDLFLHGESSEFYKKYETVYPTLCSMHSLYKKREKIAYGRGYVELESAESLILLDADGQPIDIRRRERGDAERMIEQFMLLANEAVAIYMSSVKIPCVYRIHEAPDEEKIRSFMNFCNNYKLDTSVLSSSGVSAMSYSRILAAAREKGIADIVSDSMLRSFMKARYSEIRSQHFGLALDYYAHFTSPIRRYPDLAVHRILSEAIQKYPDKAKRYTSFAKEAAIRSSENELRALNAERAIDDLYKTLYMKKHEGEEYDARISSVQSFGFFAVLDNTCEGLVPIGTLDGYYIYSEDNNTLSSKGEVFRAGDIVKIRVKYADTVRRKVEFEYIETIEHRGV